MNNPRAALGAAVTAGVMALAGCRGHEPPPPAPPLVQTSAVEKYQGEASGLRYSATIVPLAEVPLAFKVEGYVTHIKQVRGADGRVRYVHGGDRVHAGELLARVRRVDYSNPVDQSRAQVEQSRAGVDQSRAGVSQGQSELRRTEAEQRASESALGEAQAALQAAESGLAQSQAQERQAISGQTEAEAARDQSAARVEDARVARRQAEVMLKQTEESLRQTQALLAARAATETQTGLTLERQTNLFQTKTTTKAELDQATAQNDVARANVEQARAQVAELEARVTQARQEIEGATARLNAAEAQLKGSQAKVAQSGAMVEGAGAAVKTAQADVTGSRAKVEGAREKVGAAKAAVASASARLDSALAQVTGAQAQVRGAQAGMRTKQVPLGDTELRAPIDGLLLKRNIEIGTLVQSPLLTLTAAFTLADTTRVKAVFGVADVALGQVRLGQEYTVTSEARPGRRYHAIVTGITPAADPKSRVFQVEVSIPNPQRELESGMIVTLEMPGGRLAAAADVVPLSAVVRAPEGGDRYAVFVVEESAGKTVARARAVQVGQAFGNNRLQIISGLKPADRIVTTGAGLLKDGQELRVQQ